VGVFPHTFPISDTYIGGVFFVYPEKRSRFSVLLPYLETIAGIVKVVALDWMTGRGS